MKGASSPLLVVAVEGAVEDLVAIKRNEKISSAELNNLLRNYEVSTSIEGDGLVYSNISLVELVYELIADAYVISPVIDRAKAISIFRRALIESRRAGNLNSDEIISSAERILLKDRSTPAVRYTLWTKFRASNMPHAKGFKLRWGQVDVGTAAQVPAWLDISEYYLGGFGRIKPSEPIFYGAIIARCSERDRGVAAARMLDALQLVMGLINLYEGFDQWSFRTGRPGSPGKLWLGPYQFLFQGRTSISDSQIWYNPEYDADAWSSNVPNMATILKLIPKVRDAIDKLSIHPLKDVLTKSIRLMQDGFSSRDANHTLLRYWSALEQLYVEDGTKDRSNQKVINRASFAEQDQQMARWTLNHIARLRNEYVHAGGAHDLNAMNQYLRGILSRHLNHWVFTGGEFSKHHELLRYVDLPKDAASLKALRNAVDRRIALAEKLKT